jgi:hypothetical protein
MTMLYVSSPPSFRASASAIRSRRVDQLPRHGRGKTALDREPIKLSGRFAFK